MAACTHIPRIYWRATTEQKDRLRKRRLLWYDCSQYYPGLPSPAGCLPLPRTGWSSTAGAALQSISPTSLLQDTPAPSPHVSRNHSVSYLLKIWSSHAPGDQFSLAMQGKDAGIWKASALWRPLRSSSPALKAGFSPSPLGLMPAQPWKPFIEGESLLEQYQAVIHWADEGFDCLPAQPTAQMSATWPSKSPSRHWPASQRPCTNWCLSLHWGAFDRLCMPYPCHTAWQPLSPNQDILWLHVQTGDLQAQTFQIGNMPSRLPVKQGELSLEQERWSRAL